MVTDFLTTYLKLAAFLKDSLTTVLLVPILLGCDVMLLGKWFLKF
jgi:hypothetical protein